MRIPALIATLLFLHFLLPQQYADAAKKKNQNSSVSGRAMVAKEKSS